MKGYAPGQRAGITWPHGPATLSVRPDRRRVAAGAAPAVCGPSRWAAALGGRAGDPQRDPVRAAYGLCLARPAARSAEVGDGLCVLAPLGSRRHVGTRP